MTHSLHISAAKYIAKDQLMLRISDEFEVLLLTRPQSTDMGECFTMQGLLRKSVGLLE